MKDQKDELFKIKQDKEESLEDYLEKFLFVHKTRGTTIYQEFVKTIFLRGITESSLDVLNAMGKRNINTLPLDDILDLCRNYSRARNSTHKIRPYKHFDNDINELIDELKNFKTNILVELSWLEGVANRSNRAMESQESLAVYYPRCKKKHALHECPLNKTKIYSLCNENHATDEYDYFTIAQMSIANMIIRENAIGLRMNVGFQNRAVMQPWWNIPFPQHVIQYSSPWMPSNPN